MTRKIRPWFFLSLMVVLPASLVWSQPYPEDIKRILDLKKIIVAMIKADYPPIIWTGEDGEPQGFDVQIAQDIAQKLGVELEINRTAKTFDDVVEMVAKQEADLGISFLTVNLHRAKMVYYSQPYLMLRYGVIVNRLQRLAEKKKFPEQKFRDTGGTVALLKESAFVPVGQAEFPQASFQEFDTFPEMLEAVSKGKVMAVVGNDLILKRYLKLNPSEALRLEIRALDNNRNPIAIAVRPDSPHLLAWLNTYLNGKALPLTADEVLEKNPLGPANR